MNHAEVAIIGAGAMGSAIAWQLSRVGIKPVVFESFSLIHDLGSSHGATRVIRKAYFEHPAYVPLVQHSYDEWHALEQATGQHLLTTCPCLNIGPANGDLIKGVKESAKQHRLDTQFLASSEIRMQYPQFNIPDEYSGILENDAGFLHVEKCLAAFQSLAQRAGARFFADTPIAEISADDTAAQFTLQSGEKWQAEHVIICAGPWMKGMLKQLGTQYPLKVMRQTMQWYATSKPELFGRSRFPIFLVDASDGVFYGIPMIDANGVKIARHYGAPELESPPEAREIFAADEHPVRGFINEWLPQIDGTLQRIKACLYTLTPDRHFLIDRHPRYERVLIAGGFSGHGFKFAPAVGNIIKLMLLKETIPWDISMFHWRA